MSLAPFIVSILILGGFFIYGSSEFIDFLQQGAVSGDYSHIDEAAHPIFAYLLGFAVFNWLLVALVVLFGSLGVILVSLVLAVLVVGFMTPVIVEAVRKKSYMHVKKADGDGIFLSVWVVFKIFMKFLLLFLCTLPLLMLPFINFFIFQLPFFYLFYSLMMYDLVSSGVCNDAKFIIKENRVYLFIVMAIFFFLSLIPLLGLLLQVFFVVYLSHFLLSKSNSVGQQTSSSIETVK